MAWMWCCGGVASNDAVMIGLLWSIVLQIALDIISTSTSIYYSCNKSIATIAVRSLSAAVQVASRSVCKSALRGGGQRYSNRTERISSNDGDHGGVLIDLRPVIIVAVMVAFFILPYRPMRSPPMTHTQ